MQMVQDSDGVALTEQKMRMAAYEAPFENPVAAHEQHASSSQCKIKSGLLREMITKLGPYARCLQRQTARPLH